MKLRRDDLHLLSGVYVLDALDSEAERGRFERHLTRCHSCSGEVRGLREVTTRLALAAALQPPAAMHRRVLATVRRTRQLPPTTDVQPRAGRWRTRPGQRSGWLPRLAITAATVGLAVAVALGVILTGTQHRLNAAQTENRAIARVLAAPDTRVLRRPTSAGGTATVIVSPSERALIVTTAGLRPLPTSKVYEAWLINPRQTRAAGLLQAAHGGRTQPLLATGLSPGDEFGLTVEPAGGTTRPTTAPILVIPLPV